MPPPRSGRTPLDRRFVRGEHVDAPVAGRDEPLSKSQFTSDRQHAVDCLGTPAVREDFVQVGVGYRGPPEAHQVAFIEHAERVSPIELQEEMPALGSYCDGS